MTIDKQIDRTATPLSLVFDQNDLEHIDHTPDQPVADERNSTEEFPKPTLLPTNAFEGFGSFAG